MLTTTLVLPSLASLLYPALNALLWGALVGMLWYWLRGELTPRKFLSIWESDGILSTRLLAATALLIWGMFMYSARRMDDAGLGQLLGWVTGFFAVGGVSKVANAFSAPTTVNSKSTQIDADKVEVKNEPSKTDPE